MSRIIRLTESDLTRIVKNVIMQSNKKKSILKEDCVQSMALINPRTGKPAYIDTITGKYCNPYDAKGPGGMPMDYNPLTKTGLLQAWVRSYPCVPYDKRFKRVSVEPTESRGPIAFDFNNNGNLWRYFDNGIKQKINGYTWNDVMSFENEVNVTGAKFSCKDEEFKGLVTQDCKTKTKTELIKAVSFWKNWLNDPITRKKVEKNWIDEANFIEIYSGYHRVSSNYAWSKYFDILNNLNLIFYDKTNPNEKLSAFAYVTPGSSLYDIHINCAYYNIELLETLVHEIQHLLYHVKPLNPAKKIRDAFVDKNTKIENINNIFNFDKLELPFIIDKGLGASKDPKMLEISKKLNINYSVLEYWKDESIERQKGEDPGYVCRETEKMSNIYAIRSLFGIKASGKKITLNMLMPYIKREKNHGDIDFIIMCWAQRGFPDINGMIDKINGLAFKQDDEKPKIGDLPKPNFS
jgi:hypothetical protein